VYLALNETLIAFGSAVEDKKFEKAADILENLPSTPETEAMWKTLSDLTLKGRKLHIAERCFAALGDVAKARYIRKVNRIAAYAERELGVTPGTEYFVVKAKLEILEKQFGKAETLFLEQGQAEDAMEMYQELHKWEEAIRVAEMHNHPDLENLRRNYFEWLISTRQEGRAALLKEREGEYHEAVNLYLKGGLPAKAAILVSTYNLTSHADLLQRVAEALFESNLFEKAGGFFEKLGMSEKALDAYRRGHAYRAAVELCRTAYPQKVVMLEEEWADWLVSVGQVDQAINHFIEAGQYSRAIEAAITSKQWNKAVTIVDNLDQDVAKKYYKQIARHYEETLNYDLAERYYVKGGLPDEAVEMYTRASLWDRAHAIAITYMSEKEVKGLYLSQAQKLEAQAKHKEAEKLYITISEFDQAINMYKKAHKYEDMMRLVYAYHKDKAKETHLYLAQQLEAEGQFKLSERHYIDGGDWKAAVSMYRAHDLWEEALRVAKQFGGNNAYIQVAAMWARAIGGEAGVNLLLKFGLIEPAVDFAVEIKMWKKAEEICRTTLKRKLQDVYLKHAMDLEYEERFAEAEAEFIKAGSPKDAIEMYIEQHDWANATRVAEAYDPSSVVEVLDAQARVAIQNKDYARAEQIFIMAHKPEEAVKMYKELGMWNDMVRVTQEHMADKMVDFDEHIGKEADPIQKMITNKEYGKAIDALMKKTTENTSDLDALEEAWEK
jgi:intraflagellar transport protein 172